MSAQQAARMAQPFTALLVDDEPHIRLMVRRILQKLDIPVILEAGNGLEACTMYRERPVDLVLMDINMPVMGGIEALEAIQEADPDAAVIMLTSLAARKPVEESARAGARHYLRKDLPPKQLQEHLRATIEEVFCA